MSKLSDRLCKIHEPQVVAVLMASIYGVAFMGGILSVLPPVENVSTVLSQRAMDALGILLIGAGVTGIPAALYGLQWLERYSILSMALATGIYAAIILEDYLIGTGNRPITLSMLTSVILFLAARWYRIRSLPYDPVLSKTGREVEEELDTHPNPITQ